MITLKKQKINNEYGHPGDESVSRGNTLDLQSTVSKSRFVCVCLTRFHCPESSQTIEVLLELTTMHSADNSPSSVSHCLPEELALCNTKYLHYFIFFISMLFLEFALKYSGHIKIGNDKGCPSYRHTSINPYLITLLCYLKQFICNY